MANSITGTSSPQVTLDFASISGVTQANEARAIKLLNNLFGESFLSIDLVHPVDGPPGETEPAVPAIDDVWLEFDPAGLALVLRSLQQKTEQSQLNSAEKGLQISQTKLDEMHQKSLAKISEWIQNCEDAEAKRKAAGPLDWLAKIGAFVGAVVTLVVAVAATGATGGAAAPLLVVAVAGIIGTGMSLASAISQSEGGLALNIGSLMARLGSELLTAFGVPADKIEAASKVFAGSLTVLFPALLFMEPALLGDFFGGIASLGGADSMEVMIIAASFTALASLVVMGATMVLTGGAAGLDGTAKLIQTCGRIAQAFAGIVSGSASVASGGLRANAAQSQYTADTAQVEQKQFEAFLGNLSKRMESQRDEIEVLMRKIEECTRTASDILSSSHASNQQIIRNTAAISA